MFLTAATVVSNYWQSVRQLSVSYCKTREIGLQREILFGESFGKRYILEMVLLYEAAVKSQ